MQEMINKQYLGGEKEKKKVKKPSEKFRFNFDWEATDDTSRDLNPLYQDPQTALLLFGRGMRAGVDRREQKKSSAAHENELLRKMREAQVSGSAILFLSLLEKAASCLCTAPGAIDRPCNHSIVAVQVSGQPHLMLYPWYITPMHSRISTASICHGETCVDVVCTADHQHC